MNFVSSAMTRCRQTNSFKTKAKRIVLIILLASRYKNKPQKTAEHEINSSYV